MKSKHTIAGQTHFYGDLCGMPEHNPGYDHPFQTSNLSKEELESVGIRPFEDEAIASADLASPEKQWEEEFDDNPLFRSGGFYPFKRDVKDFIRDLLSHQRQETIEMQKELSELIEIVGRAKQHIDMINPTWLYQKLMSLTKDSPL